MPLTPLGSTSQWIAASRALESESADPLFQDPFARDLAGENGFRGLADILAAPGHGPWRRRCGARSVLGHGARLG